MSEFLSRRPIETLQIVENEGQVGKAEENQVASEEQNLRYFYRKRFLTLLKKFSGAPCEVHTRNGIVYKCVCARADPKFNTLCLDDVNTGIGNITHAFMRTSDIEYMQLKIDS